MRRALLAVLLALALAAPAAGAPRASLPDVEDEVMCVQCGTVLTISESAVADRERAFIRRRIAEGMDKQEIKRALEREYGPAVLAMPGDDGFDVTNWLVPGLLVLLGLVGVTFAARRWRRGPDAPGSAATAALDPDDAVRLDAELAAFDRR